VSRGESDWKELSVSVRGGGERGLEPPQRKKNGHTHLVRGGRKGVKEQEIFVEV